MASRRLSKIEVAAIATIVLSVVVLAVVLLSPLMNAGCAGRADHCWSLLEL